MATLEELQSAIDNKTLDTRNLNREQRYAVDELFKAGQLTGYESIDQLDTEIETVADKLAEQKTKQLQPFEAATGIGRAGTELVGEVAGGLIPWIKNNKAVAEEMIKGFGQAQMGMNEQGLQALRIKGYQFDKYSKMLQNLPVIKGFKLLRGTASVVGKMADGFRTLSKTGGSQLVQTEFKSIAGSVAGAGAGSLAFDAANFATDFGAAVEQDLANVTDDEIRKLPPVERSVVHATQAMKNAALWNAGAFALGPLFGLAAGGVKSALGLSGKDAELVARYSRETGVPTNYMALINAEQGFLARGAKNILKTIGIFPLVAGPGQAFQRQIERETFTAMLDHLEAGAPLAHAELLGYGALKQIKNNFKQYHDMIGVKYDYVMKEADAIGAGQKVIPITNIKKTTEKIVNELNSMYPQMNFEFNKTVAQLTEFDDPLVKFVSSLKSYTDGYESGLTAKEFVGLQKMLTGAYNQTRIYDPRGLVRELRFAIEKDFNGIANPESIQSLLTSKPFKDNYDNLVQTQGKEVADQYLQKSVQDLQSLQKSLLSANTFFTDVIRPFQKGPIQRSLEKVDKNVFENVGLLGVVGDNLIMPDELWSKSIKQIMTSGSPKSIQQLKYMLGYEKGGVGKDIFDRFKSLYVFDAFQHAYAKKPTVGADPLFDLMEQAQARGVIKDTVDEANRTVARSLRKEQFVDPERLIKSGLGETKFVDMKYQADSVADFDVNKFRQNLGLTGTNVGPSEYRAARERLIEIYGGGKQGEEAFKGLEKILKVMEANQSYTIGDTSSFIQRRAMLGGVKSLAGGVLIFSTAGPITSLGLILAARMAGSVLTDPKNVKGMAGALDVAFNLEKNGKKIGLSTRRMVAQAYNAALAEDKDAPKVDPDLININEIRDYLLQKPTQQPIAYFSINGLNKKERDRMYPEAEAIKYTSPTDLASGNNFIRGAAKAKELNTQAGMMMAQASQAPVAQQAQGQVQQPTMAPAQAPQSDLASTPGGYEAVFPNDPLGKLIAERGAVNA